MKAAPARPSSPEEYISTLPSECQQPVRTLHEAIRKAAPTLKPEMGSGMIGYGKFRYRYESGREGDGYVIGLAARKSGISLYVCSVENGTYLAEKHASKLGRVDVGRSCIRFKRLDDLNLPAALSLITRAEEIGGAGAIA